MEDTQNTQNKKKVDVFPILFYAAALVSFIFFVINLFGVSSKLKSMDLAVAYVAPSLYLGLALMLLGIGLWVKRNASLKNILSSNEELLSAYKSKTSIVLPIIILLVGIVGTSVLRSQIGDKEVVMNKFIDKVTTSGPSVTLILITQYVAFILMAVFIIYNSRVRRIVKTKVSHNYAAKSSRISILSTIILVIFLIFAALMIVICIDGFIEDDRKSWKEVYMGFPAMAALFAGITWTFAIKIASKIKSIEAQNATQQK